VSVAVITGGGSGIGAACVAALSARGVRTAVVDLQRGAAGADLDLIFDVRDRPAFVDAIERTESSLGPIDYLVTAAGYYRAGEFESLSEDAWREMLEVHVHGTANAWRAVLPGMRARRRGAVCAIGSELGLIGDPMAPHYAAAKGAIHAMVKSLAVEVAGEGIRVNCVAPGPTDTPLMADDPNASEYASLLPLGRLLTPDEIAAAVCFVLLEDTNLLGQVVSPNGGAAL
jgi:NAD(P)-dependent dehydrogenase (short-subunit alcohol dehydrogenase family)